MKNETWLESIIQAFKNLGGEAKYDELYPEIKKIRLLNGINLTSQWKASVRRTIEDHSSDSNNFRSDDVFRKLGYGYWGLRNISNSSNYNDQNELYIDGITRERLMSFKIRNRQLILERKKKDNYTCQACGFYYKDKIVECHHLKPLAENCTAYNSINELITLCPNCHSLAHVLLSLDNKFQRIEFLLPELKQFHAKTEK